MQLRHYHRALDHLRNPIRWTGYSPFVKETYKENQGKSKQWYPPTGSNSVRAQRSFEGFSKKTPNVSLSFRRMTTNGEKGTHELNSKMDKPVIQLTVQNR